MSGCAGAHPFLRRAFSEGESKMKHEVRANHTCALRYLVTIQSHAKSDKYDRNACIPEHI